MEERAAARCDDDKSELEPAQPGFGFFDEAPYRISAYRIGMYHRTRHPAAERSDVEIIRSERAAANHDYGSCEPCGRCLVDISCIDSIEYRRIVTVSGRLWSPGVVEGKGEKDSVD